MYVLYVYIYTHAYLYIYIHVCTHNTRALARHEYVCTIRNYITFIYAMYVYAFIQNYKAVYNIYNNNYDIIHLHVNNFINGNTISLTMS